MLHMLVAFAGWPTSMVQLHFDQFSSSHTQLKANMAGQPTHG
jgi:hypothetical protein